MINAILQPLKKACAAINHPGNRPDIYIVLSLWSLVGLVCYWNSHKFGLYQDDFIYTFGPLQWSWKDGPIDHPAQWFGPLFWTTWSEGIKNIVDGLTGVYWSQGRGLHAGIVETIVFLNFKLGGGLLSLQLIAASIALLNTALFYYLLRYDFSYLPAAFGTLMFIMFPGDVSKLSMHVQAAGHSAWPFVFIACMLLRKEYRYASLLLAGVSLFIYEICFLFYLYYGVYYFYTRQNDKFKNACYHVFLSVALIVFVLALRLVFKEARTVNSSTNEYYLTQLIASFFLGPISSAVALDPQYLWKMSTVMSWEAAVRIALAMSLCITAVLAAQRKDNTWVDRSNNFKPLILLSFVLVFGGYVHATGQRFPPIDIVDRFSSIHIFSATGYAIFLATAIEFLSTKIRKENGGAVFEWGLNGIVALYACLLCCFWISVSDSYDKTWAYTKTFWREIMSECPDMTRTNTLVILDEPSVLVPPLAFNKFYLTAYEYLIIPPRMTTRESETPRTAKPYSAVYIVPVDSFQRNVSLQDGHKVWYTGRSSNFRKLINLDNFDLIVLKREGDKLMRWTGSLETPAGLIPLKPRDVAGSAPVMLLPTPVARILLSD
ncbi:MAG: hypothetical protein ACAI35_00610 [Candidatus Methylacidiphilales bacterium]